MVDAFDDWDEFGFEIDDMDDHDDRDEQEAAPPDFGDPEELDAFELDGFDEAFDLEPADIAGGAGEGVLTSSNAEGRGAGRSPQAEGGAGMSWSAWDVGTIFALGGWLLDQHAVQVGAQVRAALAPSPTARRPVAGPRSAPHPAPSGGQRYSAEVGTHRIGGPLVPGWVHTELVAALARGQSLLLQAEGAAPTGGRLVLTISAVPATGGPRLWVVAEERPGGFSGLRLLPVFQRDASGGLAFFATDVPVEAADAVVWACARESTTTDQLEVVRRA